MNRFLVVFPDGRPSVSLKSMYQVKTFLKNSVPDAKDAAVYELKHNVIRNGWTFCSPRTQSKPVGKVQRKPGAVGNNKKSTGYNKWTSAELRLAIDMWNKGATGTEIGVAVNRHPKSVYSKLAKYRSSLTR